LQYFLDSDSKYLNQVKRRPFEEAREFARSLGLKSREEWNEHCKSGKKPVDIPPYPNTAPE
jgi:hypothetical protein